jgi:hypothetical protein
MQLRPIARSVSRIAVAAAVILGCTSLLAMPADGVERETGLQHLTAAFLGHFAKFAAWPAGAVAPGAVFTFCVAGDNGVLKALQANIRTTSGGAMAARSVSLDEPLPACQVLYVTGVNVRQVHALVDSFKGAAVLTVSDVHGFAEAGGIVQLRVVGDKMVFSINPAAAQRVNLALSAKLMKLATLVKDGVPDAR